MDNPYYLLNVGQDEILQNTNSFEHSSAFNSVPVPNSSPSPTITFNNAEIVNQQLPQPASQFPDIEKCIPRWKQVFPWVCWCSVNNALYCIHCKALLTKYFPDKVDKSYIIYITSSEKIFSVAKTLRIHNDSEAHKSTIYLYSFNNLIYLLSMCIVYYRDIKSEYEMRELIESLFNYKDINLDTFAVAVKFIGSYVEKSLVDSLKKSKYFSVVADQCRGILILRWVTLEGNVVEHVFWSYLVHFKMTPMQYLKQFEISFDKMTLYIANSLCQQCQRCQNLSVMQASLPPRLPSVISFTSYLWKLEILRPLSAVLNTICKLFYAFQYKLNSNFGKDELKSVCQYSIKPISVIKVLDNFAHIKKVAQEIHQNRCYIEALGLSIIDLNNDDKHKKILILLQEIIDTVREAASVNKITDGQIMKLNQSLASLKAWSPGINFVTHAKQQTAHDNNGNKNNNSETLHEFLYFVEQFIDENQKSVYYNGRERVRSFIVVCNTKMLTNSSGNEVDNKIFLEHFNVVYHVYAQILKSSDDIKEKISKDVERFHNYVIMKKKNVATCVDVMKVFHEDPKAKALLPEAYDFFVFCSSMPFQQCHIAKSLFLAFILEQRFEVSYWGKMFFEIKPWLLYLHHELNNIPKETILKWWLESW
ncbi:UNVERIFIED_CONTAM: hypothetical protein RMT77_012949 [Armadillidium vulgare]